MRVIWFEAREFPTAKWLFDAAAAHLTVKSTQTKFTHKYNGFATEQKGAVMEITWMRSNNSNFLF